MPSFSTGLSAITTSERLLRIVGQNIANAGTPGYHRQVGRPRTRAGDQIAGVTIGSGVDLEHVDRLRDRLAEAALTRGLSARGTSEAMLRGLRRLETLLAIGEGALPDMVAGFFDSFESLTTHPDDLTLRRTVLSHAAALAREFNVQASELQTLQESLFDEANQLIDKINSLAGQIKELNTAIYKAKAQQLQPNDLLDQRDQLINELAELVGLQTIEQENGVVAVLVGGALLAGNNTSLELELTVDDEARLQIVAGNVAGPLELTSGQLASIQQLYNEVVPHYRDQLDSIARALIENINKVHATGIALDGPFDRLVAANGVLHPNIPLASAGLTFELASGELVIGVTETATGERRLYRVTVDPSADTLEDLADAISALPHLHAGVEEQTGRLYVAADSGYRFDFAGGLESVPDLATFTGSSLPRISGQYSGETNRVLEVRVAGSGEVGVSEGIAIEVLDESDNLIATLSIGSDYEPGSALALADGIELSFGAGSVSDGDEFEVQAVATPDTANVLAALGINSFWDGVNAATIRVADRISNAPALLAASLTGEPGDSGNARRMALLRFTPLLNGQTIEQSYADLASQVGAQVQTAEMDQNLNANLVTRLEAERDSTSGVDTNEELVLLIQYQRQFQTAARYIAIVNETLEAVLEIV